MPMPEWLRRPQDPVEAIWGKLEEWGWAPVNISTSYTKGVETRCVIIVERKNQFVVGEGVNGLEALRSLVPGVEDINKMLDNLSRPVREKAAAKKPAEQQEHAAGLDQAQLRALAVRCDADPRTVQRMLKGGTVRGSAGRRIEAVLKKEGFLPGDYVAETAKHIAKTFAAEDERH
jgi:hypothetical protein